MNVLINGANGKMGKKVIETISGNKNLTVVCGVDKTENSSFPFPVYKDLSCVKEKVDIVIDFSTPTALNGVLEFLDKTGAKAVLCTTGYSDNQIAKIEKASKNTAIVCSDNMSVGINLLINLIKECAIKLPDFDVEIVETHHSEKKDSPSGTALMIANTLTKLDEEKVLVYGRYGVNSKRAEKEIGIHSIRGGNVVGKHEVMFLGEDESITITHTATDRKVFATGAVKAAEFVSGRKNGLYTMQDVIKG